MTVRVMKVEVIWVSLLNADFIDLGGFGTSYSVVKFKHLLMLTDILVWQIKKQRNCPLAEKYYYNLNCVVKNRIYILVYVV